MALNLKTTARRTALAVAVGGTALLAIFPAGAQQVQKAAAEPAITATTNCHDYKPGELMADTECEILKGRALDAANAAVERENVCKRLIVAAARGGKIRLTAVPAPGQACKVAKEFGLT